MQKQKAEKEERAVAVRTTYEKIRNINLAENSIWNCVYWGRNQALISPYAHTTFKQRQ